MNIQKSHKTQLSISGKIYTELSTNIPSTTYAIVELIKNANEAGASYVNIDIKENEMIVEDNGIGMSLEDIHNLLILSHSQKRYGSYINGRRCSGEKGIGFFSVFKFGGKVTVTTYHAGLKYTFSINMNDIIPLKDIRDYYIEVEEEISPDKHRQGTKLLIEELDEEAMNLFKTVLDDSSKEARIKKVINSTEIEINIQKYWKPNIEKNYSNQIEKEKILATATFDSRINMNNQEFFYNMCLQDGTRYTITIPKEYNTLLMNNQIQITFELYFYSFKSGDLKKISDFYKFNNTRISPVMYINDVLFENNLYNVEINASKKSKNVIRQQTGKININLFQQGILTFNSDRSQIIESTNKMLLQQFLDFVSSQSQIKIKELQDKNTPRNIMKYLFQGDKLQDIGISNELRFEKIVKNGKEKDQFDSNEIGDWLIFCSNGDKYEIKVVEIANPRISYSVSQLIVAKEYKFNEIFLVNDYKGTTRIKFTKLEVVPENNAIIDCENKKITITAEGRIEFNVIIKDEISNKQTNFSQSINCVPPEPPEIKSISPSFIHSLVSSSVVPSCFINSDMMQLINEFNQSHLKKDYPLLRCASVRLVIELMCCDILDKLNIEKDRNLSKNIKKIFDGSLIKDNFFDNIADKRDQSGIKAIYNKVNKEEFLSKALFLEDFNAVTHSGIRIKEKEFYEEYKQLYQLLYTYLIVISKE